MGSTQDVYAANLLQRCGYPLHSPEPRDELGEPYNKQGFQIGDIGHINGEGEFNPLFNICLPLPGGLRNRGFPEHKPIDFGDPYSKANALPRGHVFMTGVNREVNVRSGVAYEFTAKSHAGAILILPSGATLFDLPPDKFHLETFRQAATKYARLWCERSKHDNLYLVTGMYKTRDFTLASFSKAGDSDGKMLVEPDIGTFKWTCASETYSRTSPPDNKYENQTVLIKGFRMTVRWSWLAVIERVTRSQSPIGRRIASLIAILLALLEALFVMVSTCLSRITIEHIPLLPRLFHPSDIINRYLLDKNPRASVAITHDNEWIDMLEKKKLSPEDLMQEDRLRAFLEREYECHSESGVVYLQSQIGNTKDTDQNSESSQPTSTKECVQVVITHMRAENVIVGLERVPVGFYVRVDVADCHRRTKNKSMLVYDHVIQWDDVIHLPSDPSVTVKFTVCASYEFSPMLGRGEPLHVLEKTVGDLLNQTHPFTFSDQDGKDPSFCASLLVAVQVWHCSYRRLGLNEVDYPPDLDGCLWLTQVTEATNKGHDALLRYYADHNEETLKHCVILFNDALLSCLDEHSCRAAALCNLARAEFTTYRSFGTPHHFEEAMAHYRKALELRRDDHQDRPMTLLCLAQVFLYRSGTMGLDTSHDDEICKLLHELKNICPEGTHGRRAADVAFQTHELLGLRDSDDLGKLNKLISILDAAAQEPPDMYFDRPVRFNNLGLALQMRFQLGGNTVDLDRAIEWFQKAVQFTPTKHPDKSGYLSNLSNALLARSQRECAVPLTGKQ